MLSNPKQSLIQLLEELAQELQEQIDSLASHDINTASRLKELQKVQSHLNDLKKEAEKDDQSMLDKIRKKIGL